MWIADSLLYCWYWSLSVERCSMIPMVKWKQASALLYFAVDLQFGVLSQKEQHGSCPLAGDYMTMYLGILTVLWVYPHSHPPRMTDFISHAQESRYKLFELQFAFVELRRVESSFRGLLYLHLSTLLNSASVHDIEIYLLRRCRQSVSNMHDVGC